MKRFGRSSAGRSVKLFLAAPQGVRLRRGFAAYGLSRTDGD